MSPEVPRSPTGNRREISIVSPDPDRRIARIADCEYNTLSRVAFSAGIIDRDIMLISDTLANLKAQVEMGGHQSTIESLAKIQKRLAQFVDDWAR